MASPGDDPFFNVLFASITLQSLKIQTRTRESSSIYSIMSPVYHLTSSLSARALWCGLKRLIIVQRLFSTSQHPSGILHILYHISVYQSVHLTTCASGAHLSLSKCASHNLCIWTTSQYIEVCISRLVHLKHISASKCTSPPPSANKNLCSALFNLKVTTFCNHKQHLHHHVLFEKMCSPT